MKPIAGNSFIGMFWATCLYGMSCKIASVVRDFLLQHGCFLTGAVTAVYPLYPYDAGT